MLETDLVAKEAKIASGKLVAVKAIKRGLARWVCPAKIALALSSSLSTPPGWLEKVLGLCPCIELRILHHVQLCG